MADSPNSSSQEASTPKRRWYQYSLRTLVLVMVLLCFLFAWIGVKIQQAEKQKAAVAWVREKGGWVYYDYEHDSNDKYTFKEPPGPDWLRERIGIDYFCNVEKVGFWYGKTDFDLTPLQDLPFLKKIWFGNLLRSNKELRKLQEKLPNCEIIRDAWMRMDGEISSGDYLCKQCNDWHLENSDPHTVEP